MKNLKPIFNFLNHLFLRLAHVFEHLICDEVPHADWDDVKEE